MTSHQPALGEHGGSSVLSNLSNTIGCEETFASRGMCLVTKSPSGNPVLMDGDFYLPNSDAHKESAS